MQRQKKLAGGVLAGGRALRFGADKTRLLVEGSSLSSRLLAAQARAGLSPLFLCADAAPSDLPRGVRLLPDERPGLGPLGALATVLARAGGPILVAAGDMPGLGPAAFKALIDAWSPGRGGLVAVAPDGLHPLLAIYEPSLLPSLRTRLERGQRALQAWVLEEALPRWPVPDPAWVANIHTPDEWRAWQDRRR